MMVELGVREHGDGGGELEQRPVGLVGLDHEPLPFPPARVRPRRAHRAADQVARIHPHRAQRVHEHARGRRLAVRPGDRDRRPQARELAQQLRAMELTQAPLAARRALRVAGRDRGGDHELGPGGDVVRGVPGDRLDPGGAQRCPVGRARRAIGPGDLGAERTGDHGKAAHARAADADEVQPPAGPGSRGDHARHHSAARFAARSTGQPRGMASRPERIAPGGARGLRLRDAAPRAGGGDRGRARRPGRARGDVHRLGQVRHLPDRRAAAARRHRGRLPPDRAPARAGRRPAGPRRRRRRPAQLEHPRGRARGGTRRARRGGARVRLPRPRAARQPGRAGRARGRAAVAARRRRGALHLGVGARLPARLPAPGRGGRGARPPPRARSHRDGRAARARGDRRAARAPGPARS